MGYLGSRGTNLRISRNINQPVNGVRPFAAVSAASPILPGTPLGNITQVESSGFSRYNGAWVSVTKRLSHGLQFDTSYTLVEVARHQLAQFVRLRGPGQLRHRRTSTGCRTSTRAIGSCSAPSTTLPSTGHALTRGWQVAAIIQSQSGNPVNIVTSNSTPERRAEHRASGCDRARFASSARWTSGSIRRCSSPSIASAIWAGTSSSARPSTNTDVSLDQERASAGGVGAAVSRGRVRPVQPPQLRPAGQHRRQPDVRQDHAGHAFPPAKRARRGRFRSPPDCRSDDAAGESPSGWYSSWRWCASRRRRRSRLRRHLRRTVLAIHWGAEEFPATPVVNEAIREALRSDRDVPDRLFRRVPGIRRLSARRCGAGARRLHPPEISEAGASTW